MLACAIVLTAITPAIAAPTLVRDDDGLRRALTQARPGTVIRIAPGDYRGGLSATLRGTAKKPIVIEAADPKRPPVIRGGNCGLHLVSAAHVTLHGIVIEGARQNGLNVDDGGTVGTPAHHVRLEKITVRDIGPRGNCDGIKLSGLDDFAVVDCVLERWGSGGSGIDMVGCHDGEIRGCTFRHGDEIGGSGVQAKGGTRAVAIRRCRFEHAGQRAVNLGGSTGAPYFRPLKPGYEAKDMTVEDCVFIGSSSPVAFVGVDGAVVRHCVFYRPTRWLLRILQESRGEEFVPCRNGVFSDNIVAFKSAEIRTMVNVGPGTSPKTFRLERNVWFCIDTPGRSRPQLPISEKDGVHGKDPRFVDAEKGDFHLRKGSPARRAGPREPAVR
jgi:Right handed beta helix region